MKRFDTKSHCVINFALEAIGDPWSLLIVRDIVFDGKHTFKEFMESDEKMATNILSNRLALLEHIGIITKTHIATDRRKNLYTLTEKGIDLIPALLELASWSFKYDPETAASKEFAAVYYKEPLSVTKLIQSAVRQGRSTFVGPDSVISELGLK